MQDSGGVEVAIFCRLVTGALHSFVRKRQLQRETKIPFHIRNCRAYEFHIVVSAERIGMPLIGFSNHVCVGRYSAQRCMKGWR